MDMANFEWFLHIFEYFLREILLFQINVTFGIILTGKILLHTGRIIHAQHLNYLENDDAEIYHRIKGAIEIKPPLWVTEIFLNTFLRLIENIPLSNKL